MGTLGPQRRPHEVGTVTHFREVAAVRGPHAWVPETPKATSLLPQWPLAPGGHTLWMLSQVPCSSQGWLEGAGRAGARALPWLRACEDRVCSAASGSSGWLGSRRRSSATPGRGSTAGRRRWGSGPASVRLPERGGGRTGGRKESGSLHLLRSPQPCEGGSRGDKPQPWGPRVQGVLTEPAVRLTCHTMLLLQSGAWGSKRTVSECGWDPRPARLWARPLEHPVWP